MDSVSITKCDSCGQEMRGTDYPELLRKEVEYWKSLASYLASCHAAMAEYDGTLKGVSASRKKRFGAICVDAAMGLSGRWHEKYPHENRVQLAIDRCTKAAEALK
jgi:hypothetical protein